MGIRGRFFCCLEEMSTAKIKLLNKMSEKIELLCGTEQGHPMSPELFKCFIHQLSVDLNNVTENMVPELNSVQVTHLLWADDLVLLALDYNSLQSMLDVLFEYCNDWGQTVNTSKTAIMVFNGAGGVPWDHIMENEFEYLSDRVAHGGHLAEKFSKKYCYYFELLQLLYRNLPVVTRRWLAISAIISK